MKRIVCLLSLSVSALIAQTWTGATSTDWGTTTNWTPNTVPNSTGAIAMFSTPSLANQPNLGGNFTVGSIQFTATGGNEISATAPTDILTIGGSGTISATTAGNEISAPLTFASGVTTTVSSGLTLTLSGVITGPFSLTSGGAGTTVLSNASNTYSGSGGTIISSGILQAVNNGALGQVVSAGININSGTFQAGGTFSTLTRIFNLSGTATIDTMGNSLTIPGLIQGDSLTVISTGGTGTLILQGASNSYTGGTTVSSGTLNINADRNLGSSLGGLNLNSSTLQFGSSFDMSSLRTVTITGAVAIDIQGFDPTISSSITGSGSLTINGTILHSLLLQGNNSYTGGTIVSTITLQGNTSSLQGAFTLDTGAILAFNQSGSGTYGGQINGDGTATLNLLGGGPYTFTGDSSASLSAMNLTGSSLILTGSLGAASLSIDSSSSLQGTGTVTVSGSFTNQGQIIPGSSGSGTLFVNGAAGVTFNSGSGGTLVSNITPLTNGLLQVQGTATLTNGHLTIQPNISGFYGFTRNYTLVSAGSIGGVFDTPLITDPNFLPTVTYTATEVQLLITILSPFLHFPFANANERSVGNNIDAIGLAGLISADMEYVIDTLAGQSDAVINRALDQMHPAALSAFAELQTELGGQLLSLFHRRFELGCSCSNTNRIWVEPFGNWLEEKQQGMEIGFDATTRGVAIGYDHQFLGCWTIGIGGAYNDTDLKWSLDRGYAYVKGAYGSFYTDLIFGNFYLGASAYAGKDWYDTIRQIHFTSIDRQAKSNFSGFDAGGQLTAAYFFGNPACLLYPYATVDYLYLKNQSFSESGALSLDLNVDDYTSSTLRAEAGGALRFVDRNRDETICISPLISMGYVLELPLHREHFRSTFSGEPISFTTQGWDMAWQLLNLKFGLALTYRCFTLDSQYIADISTEGGCPFFNQRANFRFSFGF